MSTRPEPPLSAEDLQQFSQHVTENPTEWLMYIRNLNSFTSQVEEEVTILKFTVSNLESRLHETSRQLDAERSIVEY